MASTQAAETDTEQEFREAASAYALAFTRYNEDPGDGDRRLELRLTTARLKEQWNTHERRRIALVFADRVFILGFTHEWAIFDHPVMTFPDTLKTEATDDV